MSTTSFLGDKPINRIGFGAMQLAGPGVFGPPSDPDGARAVLRRAVDLGVDHIDTSQFYGPDVVNELIRDALYPYPEHLKLATKVGARRDESGGWLPAQSPAELRAAVEDNLRTLRLQRIDLVNLRLMDEHDADRRLPEQLGALEDLRREGKLDLIGISNAAAEPVRRGLELVDLACVQNAYSVVNRGGEDDWRCARSAALRSCRSSRSAPRSRAGRRSLPPTHRSPSSPPGAERLPRRSRWRGCCTARPTSC
jgi:aryl-alcohol dehydrogenase-like predicted oxidoreductase